MKHRKLILSYALAALCIAGSLAFTHCATSPEASDYHAITGWQRAEHPDYCKPRRTLTPLPDQPWLDRELRDLAREAISCEEEALRHGRQATLATQQTDSLSLLKHFDAEKWKEAHLREVNEHNAEIEWYVRHFRILKGIAAKRDSTIHAQKTYDVTLYEKSLKDIPHHFLVILNAESKIIEAFDPDDEEQQRIRSIIETALDMTASQADTYIAELEASREEA